MGLILITFALPATCFLFIFTCEALPHRGCSMWSVLHIWEFAVGICRGYLPLEFAVAICHWNLPGEFAVAICRGFFVCISESFLYMWANLVCMEANLFYMCAKLFDLWDFPYWQCFSLLFLWQLWATVHLKLNSKKRLNQKEKYLHKFLIH